MRYNIMLAIITIALNACQNISETQSNEAVISHRNNLRINFNENVQSLNPIMAVSNSEKFICELVYQRLVQSSKKGSFKSQYIKRYKFDTINNLHRFELYDNTENNKTFRSGELETWLKTLFISESKDSSLHEFFSSVLGYQQAIQYRSNGFLPSGINIENDTIFSIRTIRNHDKVLEMLSEISFSIISTPEIKGSYEVTENDDDISYLLESIDKKTDKKVERIQVRFIKNEDQVISEFLNKQLDIITFNPINSTSKIHFDYINKQINTKYPDYRINISNISIVEYATIYNVADSTLMSEIHESLGINQQMSVEILNLNGSYTTHRKTIPPNVLDTTSILPKIRLIDKRKLTNDVKKYYSTNFTFIEEGTVEQTDMIVVLNEATISFNEPNAITVLKKLIDKKEEDFSFNNISASIMSNNPYYYISDYSLIGIEDYQKLSEIVEGVKFKTPKTY